jgi:hypothetical protein
VCAMMSASERCAMTLSSRHVQKDVPYEICRVGPVLLDRPTITE